MRLNYHRLEQQHRAWVCWRKADAAQPVVVHIVGWTRWLFSERPNEAKIKAQVVSFVFIPLASAFAVRLRLLSVQSDYVRIYAKHGEGGAGQARPGMALSRSCPKAKHLNALCRSFAILSPAFPQAMQNGRRATVIQIANSHWTCSSGGSPLLEQGPGQACFQKKKAPSARRRPLGKRGTSPVPQGAVALKIQDSGESPVHLQKDWTL